MLVRIALISGLALATLPALIHPAPASAQTSGKGMKLLKLSVTGNKQVPTAALDSAMTISVGQKVTRADLAANLNAIIDVYRKANVGAGFRQKMTIPHPGQVLVEYMIEEQAAPPPQAPTVLRADKVTFEGNKQVTSDAISSVITIKPGAPVDTAMISSSMQAIMALYKKANVGVQITPSFSYPQPHHAIVDYRIEEKAAD